MTQTGPYSPRYDWQAIRLDYETGVLNDQSICNKYGVSISRLRTVAKKEGWVRQPPPTPEQLYGTDKNGRIPNDTQAPPAPLETLQANAVITVQAIQDIHRKDIARVRSVANTLIERLHLHLAGKEVQLPFLGGRESPADLLEKLSRVTVRAVQLERQAYLLDAMPQNPGNEQADDATVKAVSDELQSLRQSLDSIANNRAKQAEPEK